MYSAGGHIYYASTQVLYVLCRCTYLLGTYWAGAMLLVRWLAKILHLSTCQCSWHLWTFCLPFPPSLSLFLYSLLCNVYLHTHLSAPRSVILARALSLQWHTPPDIACCLIIILPWCMTTVVYFTIHASVVLHETIITYTYRIYVWDSCDTWLEKLILTLCIFCI